MKKKTVSAICVLAVLVLMAFKKQPKGAIVCFGDSITYGANVNGHSWVWNLQQEHPNMNFVNAGRSGRRTADKAELLPVLKQHPDANYCLIFLGVNDLKNGTSAMVDSCVTNMQWMIAQIRTTNPHARIILLAPTDINVQTMSKVNVDKKYNDNTKKSLVELASKYKALAKQEHIGFISLLHAVSAPNYADGLHPNEAGQQEIANEVWKGLAISLKS